MLDQETKRRINSLRDILVGNVTNPISQVDQITNALIYKFMDDMDRENEEVGLKPQYFAGKYEKYAWKNLMSVKISSRERFDLYEEALAKMSLNENIPELFKNIFLNASRLPYNDPKVLTLFLKEISWFNYDNSENLGNAFEYLLSILGSQGDAGMFRTPRHIIDFIVEVVDPKKNESILDPACGTAGFLISAYKHILKKNSSSFKPEEEKAEDKIVQGESVAETVIQEKKNYTGDLLSLDDRVRITKNIVGYDISPDMVKLALVNLYLHKFPDPQIYKYNTLGDDKRWGEQFNVILANPPFMTPKGGISPHKRFSVQVNKAEALFVDYIAEHLSIKGRAGIIVPEGIIFQSANAYKNLRKNLIENWGLYAVVSLPSGVFQPYSGVKTSILLMDRELAKKSDEILFLKVENDGFDLGAQRRKSEKNDLPDCLKVLESWKKDQTVDEHSKIAHAVAKEKIADLPAGKAGNGDYNLTGDRYRETVDWSNAKWEMVTIGEVCDILNGYAFKSENYIDDGVRVMRITNVQKGEIVDDNPKFYPIESDENIEKYILKENDLLLSLTGNVGRVGLIKKEFLPAALNQRVACLREVDERINIKYLFSVLNTDKFEDDAIKSASGIAQKNLSTEWLKTYKIPLPPLEVQEQIVAEIEQYQKVIDGAKQVVDNWKPSFRMDPSWEMVELGEISDRVTKGTTPTTNGFQFQENGINFIKIESIDDNGYFITEKFAHINEECNNSLKRSQLKESDLLFSIAGALGRVALVKSSILPANTNQALAIISPKKGVYPNYLEQVLKSNLIQDQISGLKVGVAQNNLSLSQVSNFKIPLPPLEVQEQIVAEIEAEQKIVQANKELMEKMEKKIEAKIGEVWGDEI